MPALLPPPASKLRLPRREARAKVKRPTPQQANERPRYPALARGVDAQYAKVRAAFAILRRDWLKASGLADEPALKNASTPPDFNAADLDTAIERFLETMAGAPPRGRREVTAAGEEAIVQETNFLGHRIGSVRGAEQVGLPAGDPELTRLQRIHLNERAYERLTADGHLRFETRLGEIKQAMLDGFDTGRNPLAIARELRGDLDGYERGRLNTIVRTEMSLSSIDATKEKYREAGVTRATVLGDPGTDSLCTDHIGNTYDLDDAESLPIYHPCCACDIAPELPEPP